jgi:8-oxo-dGTP diphosphatase
MPDAPALLARGPWEPEQVTARWRSDEFEPPAELTQAADVALQRLRDRGSPSYDGLAARLADFTASDGRLMLELQRARWSLRLSQEDAVCSLAVVCMVRAVDGSWLAGRRAGWVASWAGRWALGAGGAVEVGENPTETMRRELEEEWSVAPERLRVEALVRLPSNIVLMLGQAWLAEGAIVTPDAEHDEFAWWPADVDRWPAEADEPLRRMGLLLGGSE